MEQKTSDTHQKALQINLDPSKYGTFVEIGAGQEVGRWFFRVGGASGTIALVTPRPQGREGRLSDPFFLELLAGVGEAARERGCDLIMSHLAPATYEDVAAAMTTSRADGVIFLGQSTLHAAFNRLVETEARFVVWGAQFPDQRYCSIGSDNVRGGRRATAHLARLGRTRISFLGDLEAPEVVQRHQGYIEALEEAGLPFDPDLVVPAHFEIESAEAAVDAMIARGVRFDGLVAQTDAAYHIKTNAS